MKKKQVISFLIITLLCPSVNLWARWVWSPQEGKFVNTEGQVQDTAEEIYQYALQFEKEKNPKEALDQLKNVVDKYPSSRVAPEAQYRMGIIYEDTGDYLKAFQAYKSLLSNYPQNKHYDEVVERLFRIGNAFLSGKKAKFLGMNILPSLPQAIQVFKFLVEQAPFSQYGDKASFQLGLAYKKSGKFEEAIQSFQIIIDQHPQSPLIPDARYQVAETSYLRSTSEFRNQRALDNASQEVGKFLQQYPDATSSEKANKLKQAIDETNAEKNYNIAHYYERDHYIASALIYYTDAAERYPETKWGIKAKEKIRSLKEPASYQSDKAKKIHEELQILEAKLKVVPATDSIQRERLKRKIEILQKREKNLSKEKRESLTEIQDDINRRQAELKQKFKNFEKKKKQNAKNTSADYKNSMERWENSLRTEQDELNKEKEQLTEWRSNLGVREKKFGLSQLPFMPEQESEIDKIRDIEAKKLYKLSMERKDLLEEKELLYKHRSEVIARVEEVTGEKPAAEDSAWLKSLDDQDQEIRTKRDALLKENQEIEKLKTELRDKQKSYDEKFSGSSLKAVVQAPVRALSASTQAVGKTLDKSFDLLNPFDSGPKGLESKSLQELLERQMHVKEKIANEQNLIETLNQAYNNQLAIKEQKRLLEKTVDQEKPKSDLMELRKQQKQQQKKIRQLYQEIEDLDHQKAELLTQLNNLKKQQENRNGVTKTLHTIGAPFVGTAKLMKAFIFGLPNRDVEITQSADKLPGNNPELQQKAKDLQQEIELKSLVIEGKSREIIQERKKLDILKAQGSLQGGWKFRSVMVDVPYEFIGEAIDNARKVVPKKDRDKMLMKRLEEETKKLEDAKAEQKTLEDLIAKKEKSETKSEAPEKEVKSAEALPETVKTAPVDTTGEGMKKLKAEIDALSDQIKAKQKVYDQEKKTLENLVRANKKKQKEVQAKTHTQKKVVKEKQKETRELRDELRDIERDLQKTIRRESRLEQEETQVLEKRISAIDKTMPSVLSKATTQDLLHEREQMQERLGQLALRRDFLSKEMDRFQMSETGNA